MEADCATRTFRINKTWDGQDVNHEDIVITIFKQRADYENILMKIEAPFFNDPPPPNAVKGQPYGKLWEHEVVEVFFLGKDEKYLELEFSPHYVHLALLLSGRQNAIKQKLPLYYFSKIHESRWEGFVKVPISYFPPQVSHMNAYAIHGCGEDRVYEALFPVPPNQFSYPDFHRLEYFQDLSEFFKVLIPQEKNQDLSDVWKEALENQGDI